MPSLSRAGSRARPLAPRSGGHRRTDNRPAASSWRAIGVGCGAVWPGLSGGPVAFIGTCSRWWRAVHASGLIGSRPPARRRPWPLCPLLHGGQRSQEPAVDQPSEVARHAAGQCPITQEKPHLDIPVESGLGEVGRGDEDRLVVGDSGLGMEDAGRAVRVQRPRVIKDPGSGRPRPVCAPEAISESTHELVGSGRVALPSLDV